MHQYQFSFFQHIVSLIWRYISTPPQWSWSCVKSMRKKLHFNTLKPHYINVLTSIFSFKTGYKHGNPCFFWKLKIIVLKIVVDGVIWIWFIFVVLFENQLDLFAWSINNNEYKVFLSVFETLKKLLIQYTLNLIYFFPSYVFPSYISKK